MLQEHSLKTTMETNEVTVYLNEEEAAQFILFRENYENLMILLKSNVLNQKGAAVTLHFDKFGIIRNVSRVDTLYDHRSNFQNTND